MEISHARAIIELAVFSVEQAAVLDVDRIALAFEVVIRLLADCGKDVLEAVLGEFARILAEIQ